MKIRAMGFGLMCAIVLASGPSTALAKRCTLGSKGGPALRFALSSSSGAYRELRQAKRASNRLVETATRKDGVQLQLVQSGCEHYLIEVRYSRVRSEGEANLARRAVALMKATPQASDGALETLIGLLEAPETTPVSGQAFACGDAQCELAEGADWVSIKYDMAL